MAHELESDVDGAETWLPRVGTERVVAGRKRVTWETAFPGYVLVRLPRKGAWHAAARAKGVVRLLGPQGGAPDRIPEKVMARLWAELGGADARVVVRLKDRPRAKVGHLIQVTAESHPLRSFEGRVVELRARDRVQAMLSLFGRETPVELARDQFEVVDARAGG